MTLTEQDTLSILWRHGFKAWATGDGTISVVVTSTVRDATGNAYTLEEVEQIPATGSERGLRDWLGY